MNTKSEVYYEDTKTGIYAYMSLIPFDEKTSKEVHFVSSSTGDEYGQFPSKDEAIEQANIASLEKRNYFRVKPNGDGTFKAQHGITTYPKIYLKDGVVHNAS